MCSIVLAHGLGWSGRFCVLTSLSVYSRCYIWISTFASRLDIFCWFATVSTCAIFLLIFCCQYLYFAFNLSSVLSLFFHCLFLSSLFFRFGSSFRDFLNFLPLKVEVGVNTLIVSLHLEHLSLSDFFFWSLFSQLSCSSYCKGWIWKINPKSALLLVMSGLQQITCLKLL